MQKTLVIKKGAAGDVVRTTTLFNVLEGEITWVIDPKNSGLFPDNPRLEIITDINDAENKLKGRSFDLVISLEEDGSCARLASSIESKSISGIFLNAGKLDYSEAAAGWFDMSLCSKKGPEAANALKKTNRLSYQHWLFKMIGREFSGEPYQIFNDAKIKRMPNRVGIETRVGNTWPNKAWAGYDELSRLIKQEGFEIKHFSQRENIRDYLSDIATCACMISGDSLPMHIALAYRIPCITIFNCTPPHEIYDYGLMKKIASPLITQNLYSRKLSKEVVNSVTVSEVFEAFRNLCI